MNFGQFNYLINKNEYEYYYVEKIDANSILCNQGILHHETNNPYGLEIDFSTIQNSKNIIITLSANDNYQINLFKDTIQVEAQKFLIDSDNINEKVEIDFALNEHSSELGFNKIVILPYGYSDNHLDYGCILLKK